MQSQNDEEELASKVNGTELRLLLVVILWS
jgi:hypothetical protein